MSYGHTTVKAPYPIRTAKLSTVGLDQYFGRGLQGNLQCCMASFNFFQGIFLLVEFLFFQNPQTFFTCHLKSQVGAAADNHRLHGVGRRCDTERYIHEAEERNKIKKLILSLIHI